MTGRVPPMWLIRLIDSRWWAVSRRAQGWAARRYGWVDEPHAARWASLAVRGKPPAAGPELAHAVAELCHHDWPELRAAGVRACAEASGGDLAELWRRVSRYPAVREALLANPRPVPDEALDTAWQRWVESPDDRLWDRLAGRPAAAGPLGGHSRLALGLAGPAELCRAVLSPQTPDPVRARVVGHCLARGLVPDGRVDRVVFWLLTGQVEQYRAADPDGSALEAGYAAASPAGRARIRSAAVSAGVLDAARLLVAGGRWRLGEMAPAQRETLTRRLAAGQRWPQLWRLIQELPVAEAVAAVRLLRGWRPPERDWPLLDLLLRADPGRVAATVDRLPRRADPVELPELVQRMTGAAVSADGTRVAVATSWPRHGHPSQPGRSYQVLDIDLPGGEVRDHHDDAGDPIGYRRNQLLLSGSLLPDSHRSVAEVVLTAPGLVGYSLVNLAATGDTASHWLWVGSGDGRSPRPVWLPGLLDRSWMSGGCRLASDPVRRVLAAGGDGWLAVLDDAAERVLAQADVDGVVVPYSGIVGAIAITGPGDLVVLDNRGYVRRWEWSDGSLRQVGTLGLHGPVTCRLTPVPGQDCVLVSERRDPGWLRAVDTAGMCATDLPFQPPFRPAAAWHTPGSDYLVLSGTPSPARDPDPDYGPRQSLWIQPPRWASLTVLLHRPIGELTPVELRILDAALADPASVPDPAAREALSLLRRCLAHRFGADLALGTTALGVTAVAADDIALGER